jgi:hypothetical protein
MDVKETAGKRTFYIIVAIAAIVLVAIVGYLAFSKPSSLPELGLEVDLVSYDAVAQRLQVSGHIAYEVPPSYYIQIKLSYIQDGNKTIDVEEGSYGMYSMELGGVRVGPHWAFALENLQLNAQTLQLTLQYTIQHHVAEQFHIIDSGTKEFTADIS